PLLPVMRGDNQHGAAVLDAAFHPGPQFLADPAADPAGEHARRDLQQPPGQVTPQPRRDGRQHQDDHGPAPYPVPPGTVPVPSHRSAAAGAGTSSSSVPSSGAPSRCLISAAIRGSSRTSTIASRTARRARPPKSPPPTAAIVNAAGIVTSALY